MAKVPEDLQESIATLEHEGQRLLTKGEYVNAQRLYHLLFIMLQERQVIENRRIHLGGPLHMEGISLVLQEKFTEALRFFFLAYSADTINVPFREENKADQSPAYNVLKKYFGIAQNTFESIKNHSKTVVDRTRPFDPKAFFEDFLIKENINPEELSMLAKHMPDPNDFKTLSQSYQLLAIESPIRKGELNQEKLNSILNRLIVSSPEIRKILPPVLSKPIVNIFSILENNYFLAAFINENEGKKTRDLLNKGIRLFPGLIKPESVKGSSAFVFNKSKNTFIISNKVENIFSFSLGKDSTIILSNHRQIFQTKDYGILDYTLDLAYIIFFGNEIDSINFYGYLEDLIAYSIKKWSS